MPDLRHLRDDLLAFSQAIGCPLTPWQADALGLDLPDWRGAVMIAAGVNPKALSAVMGHSTIAMTFDHYGHLMPGALEEAAEAANAYLARQGGPALEAVR